MVRMSFVIIAVVAGTSAPAARLQESQALRDVTGTWVMLVEGHQIGLELEQKGDAVEGVMHAMGQRILLIGTYQDRKLVLKGERPEDQLPHGHGGDAGPITAAMRDDGTLEGELSTSRGRTKWTGERFKKP